MDNYAETSDAIFVSKHDEGPRKDKLIKVGGRLININIIKCLIDTLPTADPFATVLSRVRAVANNLAIQIFRLDQSSEQKGSLVTACHGYVHATTCRQRATFNKRGALIFAQ